PDATEQTFVYSMSRQQYEDAFGNGYRKPGVLARLVVAIFKVLPKFGPLRPLAFEPLTVETEHMFLESFAASSDRYRRLLRTLRGGRLALSNLDLDTGARPARGVNRLADDTYDDLLSKLADSKGAAVSSGLRRALTDHYSNHEGRVAFP